MNTGHFDTALDTRYLYDKTWIVVSPLVYVTVAGERIEVPKGFITDETTFVPTKGDYDVAAVVHDWLYYVGDRRKAQADALFREAMQAAGVGRMVRWMFFLAVRVFGIFAWRKWRRKWAKSRMIDAFWAEQHTTLPPILDPNF